MLPRSSARKVVESGKRYGTLLGSGAASGLIASLALSALMLLAERVAGLPVGTFYIVLVSAVTQATDYGMSAIVQGLMLHLAAGTALGLVMSAPFAVSRRAYSLLGRFAPGFGLGAGALIWAALFVPVTFGIMMPLLQSHDGQSVISQRAPDSKLFQVAVSDLLAMMDRVIYTALAFNMLYGLVALILTRSLSGALFGRRKQVIL
ncbi:hypothetical protein [Nitrososphaera sp.]|uniref:hypothetical protein n=1 Tax=Nitrososphaera sp. TaxID=1971748 RepID=UPI00183349B2|nr:hypothetical protein [Nitrososphaera sp.]NWG37006.1 hypothetical protein [Nitrososphaera sp.]